MKGIDAQFVCPSCHGTLKYSQQYLKCTCCDVLWTISEEGISNFGKEEFWWNQIDREDMLKILEVAANKGWRSALRDELLPLTDEYAYKYALLESRADWHFLLNLAPEARVLDVGCGWGPVTISLARHYSEVFGIDPNLLTLNFLQIRADQENLTNIVLAKTDPLEWNNLPFEPGFFDLVVLNGVLEWVGSARYDKPPNFYQRNALLEIKRILKPNGKIYLGIENRFSCGNFMGNKAHNGVPFADILPRPMANNLSRLFGHQEGFRTYTYSLNGYRKLFTDCGFSVQSEYFPYPDYRFPNSIIPINDNKFMLHWAQTHLSGFKSYLYRFATKMGLAPFFIYSYGMIAERK